MPRRAWLWMLICPLLLAHAASAAPVISNVSLRGLQIGGTTTLVVQGSELAGDVKLLAPFAIAKQEVLPGGNGQQIQLALTLDATVAPGIYAVRLATPTGITAPLVLGVDALPQQPLAEQITALPVAFTGALGGGQIIKATFTGKQGQALVIDVEAQRIGANFKPVVRLYDSRGKQLTFSPPRLPLGGDARVALKLPADDTYIIELHDLVYRAGGPGFFRLKVGELAYADFALPHAVTRGTKSPVRFSSSNLGDAAVEMDASQIASLTERASPSPPAATFTGARPTLIVSEANEAVETPAANGEKQALAALPCGVTGRIAARGEEDQYLVPVAAGQKLRIDVTARRFGSLLDGLLIIRGPQGNELARNDDQPNTSDPGLEFTVPAGVDKMLVCVTDMEQRFGDEHVYHVSVRDSATPDFSATVASDTLNVPAGGTALVPVTITRTNFAGPIHLEFQGLVGDTRVDGAEIAAGATSALVTLSTRNGPVHGLFRIVAKSADPSVPLTRTVRGPAASGAMQHQPSLRDELGFAVAGEAPLTVKHNTTVEAAKAFHGGKLPLPLVITRDPNVMGDVRLRLVTTQPMPKKKIKENNQDKEVDDIDRALRLVGGMPVFKPEMTTITAELQVPGDLPVQTWPYVVVAELLSPDGKTVVATAYTTTKTLMPAPPFKLELTSTPQAEGKAGVGETGKFTGKIVREPGFAQPVTITLQGLPAEVKMIPQATVAADAVEFALPLNFEYGSKQGEFKGLKLAAMVAGENIPTATADVEVKIVAGEKPPP
jgi:hypothetical protein